jgi:hypothetical protein
VPAFVKFQIATGDRSCFIFSNQSRWDVCNKLPPGSFVPDY